MCKFIRKEMLRYHSQITKVEKVEVPASQKAEVKDLLEARNLKNNLATEQDRSSETENHDQ